MVLHTLNATPDSSAFADCLRLATGDDTILLLGDGVYAAINDSPAAARLQACAANIVLLAEDACAAGTAVNASSIEQVDMAAFVALTERYPRQMAWY